jgi:hypothetical protein
LQGLSLDSAPYNEFQTDKAGLTALLQAAQAPHRTAKFVLAASLAERGLSQRPSFRRLGTSPEAEDSLGTQRTAVRFGTSTFRAQRPHQLQQCHSRPAHDGKRRYQGMLIMDITNSTATEWRTMPTNLHYEVNLRVGILLHTNLQ